MTSTTESKRGQIKDKANEYIEEAESKIEQAEERIGLIRSILAGLKRLFGM